MMQSAALLKTCCFAPSICVVPTRGKEMTGALMPPTQRGFVQRCAIRASACPSTVVCVGREGTSSEFGGIPKEKNNIVRPRPSIDFVTSYQRQRMFAASFSTHVRSFAMLSIQFSHSKLYSQHPKTNSQHPKIVKANSQHLGQGLPSKF